MNKIINKRENIVYKFIVKLNLFLYLFSIVICKLVCQEILTLSVLLNLKKNLWINYF